MTILFEIEQRDPVLYRQQTRKSTWLVLALFALLAMGLSSVLVAVLGQPEVSNFRWNLTGVLLGLALTVVIVRFGLWHREIMAPAVYGWRLKRSLMRVTNIMHQVKAGVAQHDPEAMQVLRFYHLGLLEMHRLDGNSSALEDLVAEREQLREAMQVQGLQTECYQLHQQWLQAVKAIRV
ncbi:MAG: DUF3087 family protein [Halopseudomonas sp.]|uniref:DUF3087 family protein n=1 Tax=Halopseudomonas sp. TaxID=2901191 RepID=UPI00300367FD